MAGFITAIATFFIGGSLGLLVYLAWAIVADIIAYRRDRKEEMALFGSGSHKVTAEEMKRQIEEIRKYGAQQNPLSSWSAANYGHLPIKNSYSPDLTSMIKMRMHRGLGLQEGAIFPLDHIHAHKINDEKVAVLVVHKGQATLIEDDNSLFPSDTLVTQLRLLIG